LPVFVGLSYYWNERSNQMAATTPTFGSPQAAARNRESLFAASDSRFDRRLAKILAHATDVFYEKGYEGASMRDLARHSGMSLSGMYYYFESKEALVMAFYRQAADDTHQLIVQELQGLGLDAACGPLTMIPDNADAVVTYEDDWTFDFTTHMVSLDVAVRAVNKDKPLGSGHFLNRGVSRIPPDRMVHEVVASMFKPG